MWERERERAWIANILGNHITQPEQVSCGIKNSYFKSDTHANTHISSLTLIHTPIFQVSFNIPWLENKSKGDNRNINLPEWAPNQLA